MSCLPKNINTIDEINSFHVWNSVLTAFNDESFQPAEELRTKKIIKTRYCTLRLCVLTSER